MATSSRASCADQSSTLVLARKCLTCLWAVWRSNTPMRLTPSNANMIQNTMNLHPEPPSFGWGMRTTRIRSTCACRGLLRSCRGWIRTVYRPPNHYPPSLMPPREQVDAADATELQIARESRELGLRVQRVLGSLLGTGTSSCSSSVPTTGISISSAEGASNSFFSFVSDVVAVLFGALLLGGCGPRISTPEGGLACFAHAHSCWGIHLAMDSSSGLCASKQGHNSTDWSGLSI